MFNLKEFKINKYIILKLENGITNIYINGKFFRKCKSLLFEIYPKNFNKYNSVNSIDEALSIYGNEERKKIVELEPETEFWGHLLHSNLSFPLLKELYKCGDIKARKQFIEEIISRLKSNYLPVKKYLMLGEFLTVFNVEEINQLFQDDQIGFLNILIDIIEVEIKNAIKKDNSAIEIIPLLEKLKKESRKWKIAKI
ncbi:MAG: hypothetical protein BAJALOKI3v1_660026 [Promethearchaeota archaeon]|nr:MAG: hypothetical protein BAJALOKI3v1_660026 [Candidatus Lokiarchaeota archaeon]